MSMSPGQPPGPYGHPGMPSRQTPAPAGIRAWFRRHPYRSVAVAVAVILVAGISAAAASKPPAKASGSAGPKLPHSAVAVLAAPLACGVRVSSKHPRDHASVSVHVRTAAHARVTLAATLALAAGSSGTGRASAHGTWTRHLRVGDSAPGVRVTIAVRVSRSGRENKCQTWVSPRPAAAPATPAQSATTVAPPPAPAPPPATTAPPPPPAPAGCYPKTDGGNCYEPGEFCRDDDHGATGVAGDGEKIVCADNDGWRWEPY